MPSCLMLSGNLWKSINKDIFFKLLNSLHESSPCHEWGSSIVNYGSSQFFFIVFLFVFILKAISGIGVSLTMSVRNIR